MYKSMFHQAVNVLLSLKLVNLIKPGGQEILTKKSSVGSKNLL